MAHAVSESWVDAPAMVGDLLARASAGATTVVAAQVDRISTTTGCAVAEVGCAGLLRGGSRCGSDPRATHRRRGGVPTRRIRHCPRGFSARPVRPPPCE